MHIVFETPRLLLRRFTLEDAPLILSLNSDPDVLKYLHEPFVQDETHATEILQNILLPQYEKNFGRWAAHLKTNKEFIGWCGLKFRPELDEIDLGYRFKKDSWGHGYATEAATATLEYGFTKLRLPEITGRAHEENIASIRVLEKIGMQYICNEVVDDCPVKTYKSWHPQIVNKYS